MSAKFSFYSPSTPDVTKAIERPVEEDHTTVGVEVSFSASTEGGSGSKSAASQSNGETSEAAVADAADAAAVSTKEEIPTVADDVVVEEQTASVEPAEDIAGPGEEEMAKGGGEAADEEAYKSCAEEECAEEDCAEDENDKQEEHSVFKGDNRVRQAHSYISEVTYESAAVSAAPSTCSVLTTAVNDATNAALPAAGTVSGKLASALKERIHAMDNIRKLLKKEREQEHGLRTEFTKDIRVLEQELMAKDEDVFELRAKNDEYARQLGRMSSTINELVESNHANIERMAELELDVAVRTNTINETNKEMHDLQASFDQKVDENVTMLQQNQGLKASNEDLTTKNTEFANELENLMTSLQELIEQNTALEDQVETLVDDNKKLEDVLVPAKQKNEELLDVVEGLTASLNAANAHHKNEADKLNKENEALKERMAAMELQAKQEKEHLEKALADTTAQLTEQLSAQKDTFETQVAGLTASLGDAKTSCQKNRKRNDKLREDIEAVVVKSAKSAETASATIGQLEKDLEEEFEITTQLKRGLDDLKKLAQKHDDDRYTDDTEDLLSLLRMIQCWQLSHFQRINKLVSENKEHVRSVQTLS